MSAILLSLTLLGAAAEVQTRETPTTRLFVQTTPPGAAIKLDGKSEGTAPKVFLVPPDATKMIVEVELEGHASQRREVVIQGGRVMRIEFQLGPAPPAKSVGARKSLEPAELDAQGDRDPKALHEIAVQRAQVVVQAARAEYGHALEVNKRTPGTVCEWDIRRLRTKLELAEIDSQRAVVGDRDPKALHAIAIQRAKAVVQTAKAEYDEALELNKRGAVSESDILRFRDDLNLAEIDLQRAVVGDRDPKALHEIAVRRAEAVLQAAKAEYDLFLEVNKKDPGTVSESDIRRLRAKLELAGIDLRQAVVGDRDPKALHEIAVQRAQARLLALSNTDADNPEPGAPIEKEKLQRLAWGPAAPNGLRAACYFEPTKEAYADGEEVVRRLVFHNSGKKPVLFTLGSSSENSHQDWVVVEEPIPVPVERQDGGYGGGWSVTYRLAPGHATTGEWSPRVRLGASTKAGEGVYAAIQAKPGTTCRARWSLRVLETMRSENGEQVAVAGVWHGTLTTGEVRFRIVEKDAGTR